MSESSSESDEQFPPEGQTGRHTWVIPIVVVVVVAAAVVLGLMLQAQMEPPENAPDPPEQMPPADRLYATHCGGCHGEDGQGITNRYPPLVDTHWVLEDDERLILITLHGLRGPIEVHGRTYDGAMPGLATRLSNEEIAEILTYIRTSWDNDGDPIDTEEVETVREEYPADQSLWTAETLEQRDENDE